MGDNIEEIEKFIIKIKAKSNMKDLGEARNVLSMRISINALHLTLEANIAAKIVHEFYYSDGYIFETFMEPNAKVMSELDSERLLHEGELVVFLRLIGKLGWLCNTQPEKSFSVRKVQQFRARVCINHWKALLRIVGYTVRTLEFRLVWNTKGSKIKSFAAISKCNDADMIKERLLINGNSDADFATDPAYGKSVTGMILMIDSGNYI